MLIQIMCTTAPHSPNLWLSTATWREDTELLRENNKPTIEYRKFEGFIRIITPTDSREHLWAAGAISPGWSLSSSIESRNIVRHRSTKYYWSWWTRASCWTCIVGWKGSRQTCPGVLQLLTQLLLWLWWTRIITLCPAEVRGHPLHHLFAIVQVESRSAFSCHNIGQKGT